MNGAAAQAAAVLSELVQSLHDESDALVAGDVDALARAVQRKESALRELAPQVKLAASPAMREAVRSAREANHQNARMLSAHLNVNRARVESLLGPGRSGTIYSADGRASSAADPRSGPRGVRA